MRPGHTRRRFAAALGLGGLLALLVVVVPTATAGAAPIPGAKAGECSKVQTNATYNGTSAARHLIAVFPDWVNEVSYPCDYADTVRGMRLTTDSIELVQGGKKIRVIPFDGSGQVRLSAIVAAVNDPSWIEQTAPGVVELRAALVQTDQTSLLVAPPDVTQLRLQSGRDGVFIGGINATARFDSVTVTSWDDKLQAPSQDTDAERPHVLYQDGSDFDIVNSTFQYLGSDRTSGYGVSWSTDATGSAVSSVFQHNFFGAYTSAAVNVVFRYNAFHDNIFYGLDPHTGSTGLLVEGNEAYANGTHGIIFSRRVQNSVIRNNLVHDNGGNGIMMDFHSDHNTIEGNRVLDNRLQGIVSSGSADLVIAHNMVRGSKIGIRLSRHGADRVTLTDNDISAVGVGIQAYDGATAVTITGNQLHGIKAAALLLEAPFSVATDNVISDAPIGYDVRTLTTIAGGDASVSTNAVHVGAQGIAILQHARLTTPGIGVQVEHGGILENNASEIDAPTAVKAGPPPPIPHSHTLALIGLLLVVLALAFELVHWFRTRHRRPVEAPAHVWNVA